jgi:hypothetical protein
MRNGWGELLLQRVACCSLEWREESKEIRNLDLQPSSLFALLASLIYCNNPPFS